MERKLKHTAHHIKDALRHRDQGEPVQETGRTFNVSHITISRLNT